MFCDAHTLGSISQNKMINEEMAEAFKINSTQNKLWRRFNASSIKKLVRKIIPRLKITFAQSKLANNTFGSASRVTILLADGSGLVLIMLRSLYRSEKKATSAPLTIKEKNRRIKKKITIRVSPWLLIASKNGFSESKNKLLIG